jgi:MFS family permease
MSRLAQENILAAVLFAILAGYIAICLGFGPNARLVPLPIALVGLVSLMAQIIRQNLRKTPEQEDLGPLAALTGARRNPAAEPASATATAPERAPREESRRELMAFGVVAAFVALIVALGPVPAVFLFSGAYLSFSKHYSPWKAVSVAAAFTLAVYLLFVVALELQLYHGLLQPLVDRF